MRFATLLATGIATCSIIGSIIGVGIIFHGYCIAVTYKPKLERILFQYALLGIALCQANGAIGLGIALMIFLSG